MHKCDLPIVGFVEAWSMPNLYLFQRDLRLSAQQGLLEASQNGETIVPAFIFDPRQLKKHDHFSGNGLHFLMDSLISLDETLKKQGSQLYVFSGIPAEVLPKMFKAFGIGACYWGKDVTPFYGLKSTELKDTCAEHHVTSVEVDHLFLNPLDHVKKDDGLPYTVFTPYFRKASAKGWIATPDESTIKWFCGKNKSSSGGALKSEAWRNFRPSTPKPQQTGGRESGLSLLKDLPTALTYQNERDTPSLSSTSSLSAHLKFGTLSPREIRDHLAKQDPQHPIIRQLYWRDFLSQIAHHFTYVFEDNFQASTRNIRWPNPKGHFDAWARGQTGFPIVDAGMRQLVQSGTMHNRVRMITASFLVKDLHVDWRQGERFFAQHLTDYDPALNNGNWQWAASTGCDAQPYFRIFNPWLQQKKFDPHATYIKTWIPELANFEAKQIHRHEVSNLGGYPAPMVQHREACIVAKSLFSS